MKETTKAVQTIEHSNIAINTVTNHDVLFRKMAISPSAVKRVILIRADGLQSSITPTITLKVLSTTISIAQLSN